MLSTDWAQQRLRNACEEVLLNLLGTKVNIKNISYHPFNRLKLDGLSIEDNFGQPAFQVGEVDARIELSDFIFSQKIIVDYAAISDLQVSLYRDSIGAPLNIQEILSRFKSNEQKKTSLQAIRVNSIELLNSKFSYDVLAEPETPQRFNKSHIRIDSINAEIFLPRISATKHIATLNHFSLNEECGLKIRDLTADVFITNENLKVSGMMLLLQNSELLIEDVNVDLDGMSSLAKVGTEIPVEIRVEDGSHVYLPDLKCFVPAFENMDNDIFFTMSASGLLSDIDLRRLQVGDDANMINLKASGQILEIQNIDEAQFKNIRLEAEASSKFILSTLRNLKQKVSSMANTALLANPSIKVSGSYTGKLSAGMGKMQLAADCGELQAEGKFSKRGNATDVSGEIGIYALDLGKLLNNSQLGDATGNFVIDGTIKKKGIVGRIDGKIEDLWFKGYDYQDVALNAIVQDSIADATLSSDDRNADFDLVAHLNRLPGDLFRATANLQVKKIDLNALNLNKSYPGHSMSGALKLRASGYDLRRFKSQIEIDKFNLVDSVGDGLKVNNFELSANNLEGMGVINISSDILNGSIQGEYDLTTIVPLAQDIFDEVFPTISNYIAEDAELPEEAEEPEEMEWVAYANNFTFDFTIENARNQMSFFKFPISIVDPVTISGEVSAERRLISATIDAPWLLQGTNKLIDNTYFIGILDGIAKKANIYATTHMETKKGPMNIIATIEGGDGKLQSNFDWQIEREIPINGNLNFLTTVYRDWENKYVVDVDMNPGQINFGDDYWNILPSNIRYTDKTLQVNNFAMMAPTQSIVINGTGSESEDDTLEVILSNINLINIFETLGIDKAMIGGFASGRIMASHLFTDMPIIRSKDFEVKEIGYNRCTLGNAVLDLGFDNDNESFYFNADIVNEEGLPSKVNGWIKPATEELDLLFDANHIKVGFMHPFMEAFCGGISGYASGQAHMFGSFKYIDMTGDIYAEDVKLKIDFTNTWYSATDSIYLKPGMIDLKDIVLHDEKGHTALLNGYVKHTFFKSPVFEFSVTKARDFLSYDVPKSASPIWYGTIYGNGSAYVTGKPGVVNIGVNMTTAQNSTFTFELSDSEEAEEYSFITFRDATPEELRRVSNAVESETLKIINEMAEEVEEESPTAYNMDIQVDITPLAQIIIVMDPIGGDRIRANGSGEMHMTYGSANGDLTLFGKYTLEKGDYNFTLQDIIVKEFKIKPGSNITFNGDPYNAILDIDATYSVNANLSDLDESFLQDKDLNRTNVPVNALMKVTGEMMQPDINFDLEFPTLTQDIYRKVKSIVSTDEMMNRQIIYLLALHRFSTPEYMASTTKGNELFSVASSTISSQLSSMLGKLSDNWSIAPNLRSDRGDFSDVEVDVALSSSLLNNRLLFNGNFGYRDKSLNTNQFIGDFDIEYLLNRPGSIRLKAYNRYNDQNYYLRTAQTTQGVGIMYRKDFDNLFNFFRKDKNKTP